MTTYEKIAVIISALALSVSLISLIISFISSRSNKRLSKAALLHQVKKSIDDAKTQVENKTESIAKLQAKKRRTAEEETEYQTLLSVHKSSLEKVINSYEDGCQKYYSDLILKDEFKQAYFSDIRLYVESLATEFFSEPATKYTYILKAYHEWHNPKKHG